MSDCLGGLLIYSGTVGILISFCYSLFTISSRDNFQAFVCACLCMIACVCVCAPEFVKTSLLARQHQRLIELVWLEEWQSWPSNFPHCVINPCRAVSLSLSAFSFSDIEIKQYLSLSFYLQNYTPTNSENFPLCRVRNFLLRRGTLSLWINTDTHTQPHCPAIRGTAWRERERERERVCLSSSTVSNVLIAF